MTPFLAARSIMTDPIDELQEEIQEDTPTIAMKNEEDEASNQDTSDAPMTPPSTSRKNPILTSAIPPIVPRHERPINRRLLLQEAQERLSLPDLFAPRTAPMTPASNTARRTRTSRMLMAAHNSYQSKSSASLLPINPRAVPWGDYWENQSHWMSQRSVYGNPADL